MLDIETKVDGTSVMPAAQINSMVSELENAITSAGITLSGGDLEQLSESIAKYSSGGGQWYTDSGTADNYVLTGVLTFNNPEAYFEGMVVGAVANTTSTAAGSQINVNGIGVVALKDSTGGALVANSLIAGSPFFARYDSGAGEFRFTIESGISGLIADPNPRLGAVLDTNSFSINESEGAAVASTATPNIWAGDGNTLHITGTTAITDFTNAPKVGAWKKIIFDGILTFTHGSGITMPGGASITTAVGDYAFIYADAVAAFTVLFFRANGKANVVDQNDWKIVTQVYDVSTASGTLDITGAGFDPDYVTIDGAIANGANGVFSTGKYDGTVNAGTFFRAGANGWHSSVTKCVHLESASGNFTDASAIFITDGIRLTWAKTLSPTGSATLVVTFFKKNK